MKKISFGLQGEGSGWPFANFTKAVTTKGKEFTGGNFQRDAALYTEGYNAAVDAANAELEWETAGLERRIVEEKTRVTTRDRIIWKRDAEIHRLNKDIQDWRRRYTALQNDVLATRLNSMPPIYVTPDYETANAYNTGKKAGQAHGLDLAIDTLRAKRRENDA